MNITNIEIENYCKEISLPESSECYAIKEYADATMGVQARMVSGSLENALFKFLIKLTNPKKILEIGTFLGYSALSMAEFIQEDAIITTLDIDAEALKQAQAFWDKSLHGNKIIAHCMSALDFLEHTDEKFDLIFIDADKNNYLNYFKASLGKLSENGYIIVDNTLWSGKVLLSDSSDKQTQTIQELNKYIQSRNDLINVLLPLRDGVHLVTKK
jgi:caffeoyl-CoA O-methyltransferase